MFHPGLLTNTGFIGGPFAQIPVAGFPRQFDDHFSKHAQPMAGGNLFDDIPKLKGYTTSLTQYPQGVPIAARSTGIGAGTIGAIGQPRGGGTSFFNNLFGIDRGGSLMSAEADRRAKMTAARASRAAGTWVDHTAELQKQYDTRRQAAMASGSGPPGGAVGGAVGGNMMPFLSAMRKTSAVFKDMKAKRGGTFFGDPLGGFDPYDLTATTHMPYAFGPDNNRRSPAIGGSLPGSLHRIRPRQSSGGPQLFSLP